MIVDLADDLDVGDLFYQDWIDGVCRHAQIDRGERFPVALTV
jgi:hypothetical protein